MKKVLLTIFILLITTFIFAQRSFEIMGLPDGDTIGESLRVAIPLIVIGFLIAYIFLWRKKEPNDVSTISSNIGCLGILAMAVGAFFLLPLFAWIEYIFVNIYILGLVIIAVGFLVYVIYYHITKNKNS